MDRVASIQYFNSDYWRYDPLLGHMIVTQHGVVPMSEKLSYEVARIPQPVTNHDAYLHATLIETRLIRMTLERIAAALENQTSAVETTKAKK